MPGVLAIAAAGTPQPVRPAVPAQPLSTSATPSIVAAVVGGEHGSVI
ncbi:MAG: hypothetical protein WCJ35_13850 [Planctomycetota bacterium]